MPRKAKESASPKKFKQGTLTGYLQSSPHSSPAKQSSSQTKRRKRALTPSSSGNSSSDGGADSDVGAIHFESKVIVLSDEEQSPRRPKVKKRRKELDTASLSVASILDADSDSNKTLARSKSKKGKARRIVESEEDTRPRRSRFVKGVRPSSPEVDDIADDIDENHIIESRLRARGKETPYQKNLEKLKRRKRGQAESEPSDASESEGSNVTPFDGARPHRSEDDSSSGSEEPQSQDEESFIVEDDENGPQATQLPVAYSMSTHQDLTHQFKIICQLFVHMAVRPKFERRTFMEQMLRVEEYFSVPLQITRRKLSGIRDSMVTSSVWRPSFKKPLEIYPEFELVYLDFSVPQCDACHLGGRVSTLLGRVSGIPYNRLDFEPEDVSDEENSDSNSSDSDGESSSSVREFHLGRFCAARTRVFHAFNHWEYSLYKSLLNEIDAVRNKDKAFIKTAYFGGAKPPKDLKDPDKVMDWLDQRNVIEIEWQKIRVMMESAQNLGRGTEDATEF
ncbi:hypothetical protein BV22DRAFT_1033035 [Leucogyrophana mollusca]|uniref:Uncharacterized protein n=1 Tax=Leucogyrophana mollusca TaxID=85980 RepID=A0ACB8BP26_9AGAM|nr:hypothetical protein BV22DRAFT_1033035 [Leucogyrophana mollusca]